MTALTAGCSWSALDAAATKGPINPSLVPCFLTKTSWYFFLSVERFVMSTSLNVVSIAASFWASLSRWAMRLRMRVIATRRSRGASDSGAALLAAGGAAAAAGFGGFGGGAAAAAGVGVSTTAAGVSAGGAAGGSPSPTASVKNLPPTSTVAPSSTWIALTVPAAGERTSTVT